MPYTPPSLQELQDYIEKLPARYKALYGKDRAEDVATLVRLSKRFTAQTGGQPIPGNANRILLGAIFFFAEEVEASYEKALLSKDPTRSAFYRILKTEGPHLKEKISDKWVHTLFKDFIQYANQTNFHLSAAESKQQASEANQFRFQQVNTKLKKRLAPAFEAACRRAVLATIDTRIQKLPDEYKQRKADKKAEEKKNGQSWSSYLGSSRFFSYEEDRLRVLALSQLLTAPAIESLLPDNAKLQPPIFLSVYKYAIQTGFAICMVNSVTNQSFGLPENSALNLLCRDMLGGSQVNKMSEEEKRTCVAFFYNFISKVLTDESAKKMLRESGAFGTYKVEDYLQNLQKKIDADFKGTILPWATYLITAPISWAYSVGVGKGFSLASDAVWAASLGTKMITDLAMGAVEYYTGPVGRVAIEWLGGIHKLSKTGVEQGLAWGANRVANGQPESIQSVKSQNLKPALIGRWIWLRH